MFHFSNSNAPAPVPLISTSIETDILDASAEVRIEQKFVNKEENPIEVIYKFPLNKKASVHSFVAKIDGKEIKAIVKEKEAARNQYDDSIASGHGAYLLEQETPEIFVCYVGNLPPKKEVFINLSYIEQLEMEQDFMVFQISPLTRIQPTVSAPIKNPFGFGFAPSTTFSQPSPAPEKQEFKLKSTIKMSSVIRSIQSPSHPISIDLDHDTSQATVTLVQDSLDKDFILKIKTVDPHLTRLWLEKNDKDNALMMCFYPKFETQDILSEIVFVIDQSGSMSGAPIESAKSCLQLFLRSLPSTCLFNIVGFGSNFYKVFPSSVPYNDETLAYATGNVNKIQANLGGTEIYTPLKAILDTEVARKYSRQLMIITDGGVSNTELVLDYIKDHCNTTRIFTVGIGNQVSRELVNGMAKNGNGFAEFMQYGERMESKVMKHLRKALEPALTDVKIDWNATVKQAPTKLPPVFQGSLMTVYAFVEANSALSMATISATGPEGTLTWTVNVDMSKAEQGKLIHQLAAKSLISELEDLEKKQKNDTSIRSEIISLGTKYSLASKYTSFIAVEKRKDQVEGTLNIRKIDAAPPQQTVATGFSFASATPSPQSGSFSFATSPQSGGTPFAAATPSFGTTPSPFQATTTASTFGTTTSQIPYTTVCPSPSYGFGGPSPFGFGTTTATPTTSLFASTTAAPSYSAFGSTAPTTSLFGATTTTTPSFPSTTTTPSLFGTTAPSTGTFTSTAPSGGFGATTTTPTNSLFGSTTSNTFGSTAPSYTPPLAHPQQAPFSFPQQQQQVHYSQQQQSFGFGGSTGATGPTARLDGIIKLQSASGFWKLTDEFCRILQVSVTDVQNSLPSLTPEVQATILALAFLEVCFVNFQDEWSLLATKGKNWVISQIGNLGAYDSLYAKAKEFVVKYVKK